MNISKSTLRSLVIMGLGIAGSYFNLWIPIFAAFLALLVMAPVQELFNRFFTANSLFLFFVMAVFSFIGFVNGSLTIQVIIYYCFGAVFFYLFGSIFSSRSSNKRDILLLLLVIFFSLAFQHLVVTIADIFITGIINPERSLQILDSDAQRAVTQRTIEISLCIGSIAFLFFHDDDQVVLRQKTVFIVLGVLGVLCAIHYVSRTGVALAFISLIVGFLFSNAKISSKIFLLVLLIVALFSVLRSEVYDVFLARETDMSNVSNGGLRFERWSYILEMLWVHPWGITNINALEHGYAHNLWIDFGKVGGLLSMVLLILFSFRYVINTWKLQRNKNYPLRLPILVFSIVFFLSLMTEPIHEGAPIFFFVYFLYCGCLQQEVKSPCS